MHVELPFSEAVMRRSNVALFPIVALLALAACSGGDQGTTGPRGIVPAGASSADVIPACSANAFSTMKQDASAYFPSGDAVVTMIGDMKTAFRTSLAAATPIGFDILTELAAVRDAGSQIGTAAAGGKFADDVVGCMDLGTIPPKFLAASALGSGVFEVRGATPAAPAATAFNSTPGSTHAAIPLWGAEPAIDWTRSGATYIRYLVYGYQYGTDVRASGFELGTLPASLSSFLSTSSDAFRVGLCVTPANTSANAANRLVHQGSIVTGNDVTEQGAKFCAGNTIASVGTSSWFARAVNKAASLLSPKSLYADDFFGIGGLPDGWSPFNFNAITGSSVTLAFGPLPVDVKDSTQFTLVVHASTTNFANVPGVTVGLTVANNSGTPAQAVLIPTNPTAITDKNGDATFHIAIGKPGGYTLTATGTLSTSVTTAPFTSLVFNIKN
jgi:hypothetical protein